MQEQQSLSSDRKMADRRESRARIIKALAHPTRLMIIEELSREARCVADLTDMAGADMSTVSRHLSVLKASGIIRDQRQGTKIYYRLRMPCIMDFFGCIDQVLEDSALQQLESLGKAPQ